MLPFAVPPHQIRFRKVAGWTDNDPGTAPATQDYPSAFFEQATPRGAFVVASHGDNSDDGFGLSIGLVDENGDVRNIGGRCEDGATTSDCESWRGSTYLVDARHHDTGGIAQRGTFGGYINKGFEIDFTDVDASGDRHLHETRFFGCRTKVGTIDASGMSDTDTLDIDVGFRPRFIIGLFSQSPFPGMSMCAGICDRDLNQGCHHVHSIDGAATSQTGFIVRSDALWTDWDGARKDAVTSINSNGFTITHSGASSVMNALYYLAVGGDFHIEALVDLIDLSFVGAGNQDIGDASWVPDAFLMFCTDDDGVAFNEITVANDACFNVVQVNNGDNVDESTEGKQMCSCRANDDDGLTTMNSSTQCFLNGDNIITPSNGAHEIDFENWEAGGANVSAAGATDALLVALWINTAGLG